MAQITTCTRHILRAPHNMKMGVGSKAFINTCDNAFDNFSVSLHIWIAKTEVKINV